VLIFTGNPRPLKVDTRPVFETDSVSVTLEWMPEEGVSYNISVDQMADIRLLLLLFYYQTLQQINER
jgi:hypothetical protein